MQEAIIKFPNQEEFDKFLKYIKLAGCVPYPETLSIKCTPYSIEIEIAKKVFNAEIILL